MSVNQSRAEKNEPSQNRKSGRSGNSGQQRNSQGSGKGGGGGGSTAPPSASPSLSSSRSYKKSNNAQGGQSRVSGGIVNSDSNKASTARAVQNGAHTQPPLPGAANAPVTGLTVKPNDLPMHKNTRGVPKSPSSVVTPVSSETIRPLTPGKGLGDASQSLPLQFGSIRPDFINVMQIPARTSSAPPNFDEQKRDQARSLKPTSTLSTPTAPQQQLPKKDVGPVDQSINAEAHPMPREKRDVQVSVGPTVTQTPKHSVHPTAGNPSQVQQPVFVPGLQRYHPMHSQGIIHQGQNLNFLSQMGPQMPQLGNLGISISPQFQQQQAGKFAVPRKTTVKITHPDTHEVLRLDKRAEPYMDGGSSGPRPPHYMLPQTQPIPSYLPAHQINYYTNSYNPGSLFFSPKSSESVNQTKQISDLEVTTSSNEARNPKVETAQKKLDEPLNPDKLKNESKKKKKEILQKADAAGTTKLKKKKKEILQKADAAATIFDLCNAYKGPEEKKDISTSAENTEAEAVSSKDKPLLEPNKGKNTINKWKKKKKKILQKAVDAGTTFDLYNAYKGPEEKKDISTSAENTEAEAVSSKNVPPVCSREDVVPNEKSGQSKAELEDWEDAADISTPKLGSPNKHNREVLAKKYSRDFLMKFSEHCITLPEGFQIMHDHTAEAFVVNISCDYPSPGRIINRLMGGSRLDRHGRGVGGGDNDKWNIADSDRWQRATGYQKGLLPAPPTSLQMINKAIEERAKQRQLKGILKKLTPQNFEKLFEQVKQVNIDNTGTLTGVISRIFDKALMEPTFCEMYANFCYHLAGELPDFNEDNENITFKMLLLNKCQEEFERGEREQEEANRTEEEGEAKQTTEKRVKKRIRARKRMIGNIRLIGELYKKEMLTERIMHEWIKKLLGQYQNPDEEDVEALCKLMSTIGEIIDHPKAKEHMDVYFDMMAKLSNNMKLSSRVRFMLKDAIDLRKNKWQQRRKVEGPKKIEEVHQDAAIDKSLHIYVLQKENLQA